MSDLMEFAPWLRTVAFGLNPHMVDDLAQEGMIAMWRAKRVHDASRGPLVSWLKLNALNRMRHVQQSMMTRRGARGERPQWSVRDVPIVFDDTVADMFGLTESSDLDAIHLAYHHGQLYDAVNSLTPKQREYVYLRFWYRATGSELRAHFGYDPQGLWSSARNGARKKLREALGHLA